MANKLTLSNNKMIAGVCAGIAKHFGWDPSLTRVVYLLLTIFTAFSGVIVYLILWLVMPPASFLSSGSTDRAKQRGGEYNRNERS